MRSAAPLVPAGTEVLRFETAWLGWQAKLVGSQSETKKQRVFRGGETRTDGLILNGLLKFFETMGR